MFPSKAARRESITYILVSVCLATQSALSHHNNNISKFPVFSVFKFKICSEIENPALCIQLRSAIQNKHQGKLTFKIFRPYMKVDVHDNARPHTANRPPELFNSFKWEFFPHPPCGPNLAPSEFPLFPRLKNWLATQRFDEEEGEAEGCEWLRQQTLNFYEEGIPKLVHRYDKYLNVFGDYVEQKNFNRSF